MRFLHFSDVHLEDGFRGESPVRFLNKRFVGYANLVLRRRRKHRDAPRKMRALAALLRETEIDGVLCTGDYTALGTRRELRYARAFMEPFADRLVTVPGNHDVYLQDAVPLFDEIFGDVLGTDLPELAVDGVWPQVRFFGDHVAVVAVNSARPNPPVFRSSGRIPEPQMRALRDVLEHERVRDRFVFVMTHYAPRLEDGRPDEPHHGLENADALIAACARLERGAILHGHVHHAFQLRIPELSIPISGAGSTTYRRREGVWLYEVGPEQARATRGKWTGERYVFEADPIPL